MKINKILSGLLVYVAILCIFGSFGVVISLNSEKMTVIDGFLGAAMIPTFFASLAALLLFIINAIGYLLEVEK